MNYPAEVHMKNENWKTLGEKLEGSEPQVWLFLWVCRKWLGPHWCFPSSRCLIMSISFKQQKKNLVSSSFTKCELDLFCAMPFKELHPFTISVWTCAQEHTPVDTKMYTRVIIPVNRGITLVSYSGFSLLRQGVNQVMLTGVLQVCTWVTALSAYFNTHINNQNIVCM